MSHEFKLPELGEDVDEGDVLKVLVKSGDTVEKEQSVLEIETDKAVVEVPVDVSGRIEEVKVQEGDAIRVGQVLLIVSIDAETEERKDEPEDEAEQAVDEEQQPEEEGPPEEPEEPEEPKEKVADDEGPGAQPGETQEPESGGTDKDVDERRPSKRSSSSSVPAAPSVRRLAREIGVDIADVEATGPGGRISADDVKAASRAIVSATGAGRPTKLPDFAKWGTIRRERLSGLRRAAARNLARSWSQIPHVTQHDRADITRLDASMKEQAGRVDEAGGKLTLTAVAVYIASRALSKFPTVNASVDVANDELVIKEYRHIGVAVDTERGLLVPVVRNAERMSLIEIAINVGALAERARGGKLSAEDMDGGSFTVTNLGGIGGTSFTPIVNWPEVAILGLARARHEPKWNGGEFEPRLILPLSLSYDHRVIDGAEAARFLRFIARAHEDPFLLMLEGETA